MRILFDQGTPVPLREHLAGHGVETAYEKGWSALRNGMLLAKAEAEFDVLITTDRNLRHQQNLAYQDHNAGCWPFVGGFWVMALAALGEKRRAREALVSLARPNAGNDWQFNEWFHDQTGAPGHGRTVLERGLVSLGGGSAQGRVL